MGEMHMLCLDLTIMFRIQIFGVVTYPSFSACSTVGWCALAGTTRRPWAQWQQGSARPQRQQEEAKIFKATQTKKHNNATQRRKESQRQKRPNSRRGGDCEHESHRLDVDLIPSSYRNQTPATSLLLWGRMMDSWRDEFGRILGKLIARKDSDSFRSVGTT
jgi:hypothetical protein